MDTLSTERDNLRALLDRYLLPDLRRLRSLPPDETGAGACLYPLALTLMASIELSGALLDDAAYDRGKNEHYFSAYWQRMFSGRNVARDAGAVYNLLRHGLAHLYLPKGDVGVVRDASAVVLVLDKEGRRAVNVDALGPTTRRRAGETSSTGHSPTRSSDGSSRSSACWTATRPAPHS